MAPAPPPYQEATGDPSGPLVVRLQVWHFTRGGRSQNHNEGLADDFPRLQDWIVRPVDSPECDSASARDDFVPVEVDFENVNGSAGPSSPVLDTQVRSLFARIAPLHVYQYFLSIHSTPHIMNIRPVDTARKLQGGRYTYAFVLNSVDIRAHEFVAPAAVAGLEQDQAVSLLRGELAVYTLSTIVNAYTLISQQSRRQTINPDVLRTLLRAEVFQDDLVGDDGQSYLQCLQRRLRQLPSTRPETPCIRIVGGNNSRGFPNQVPGYGTFQPRHEAMRRVRDLQDAWNKLRSPLEQYHSLIDGKLGRGMNRLCQGKGAPTSNQDLYELILDMRKAALHLPAIERAAIPLLNFLAKPRQYHPQAIRCLYLSSGAMGLVVFCLSVMYLFPFIDSYGWTTALAALTLIGCVAFAAAALGARGLVLEERRNMLTARKTVHSAGSCINDALATVAAIFCLRVLGLPLETVGEHEKRSILGNLGVDVDALTSWDFQQEQLIGRVEVFRDSSHEMDKALRSVMKSAEVRFAFATDEV